MQKSTIQMARLKIKVSGYSGYLGRLISKELKARGHQVQGIQRELLYGPVTNLKTELEKADVIINLAGAPILTRWTKENKQEIYDSRIITNHNLVKAINEMKTENRIKKFISASAIGIYETGEIHSESSTKYDNGFMGKLVQDWERTLDDLPENVNRIIFRMAPVLGENSLMISKMLLPFKLGLGATVGSGRQAFPFIHEKDVVNAYLWAVEDFKRSCVFNLAAPEKISNSQFTKIFAEKLNRPAFFSIPGFMLKLIYGEAAETLTKSPIVETQAIQEAGFKFSYPTIDSSLKEILDK